jgi:hypothetical protein
MTLHLRALLPLATHAATDRHRGGGGDPALDTASGGRVRAFLIHLSTLAHFCKRHPAGSGQKLEHFAAHGCRAPRCAVARAPCRRACTTVPASTNCERATSPARRRRARPRRTRRAGSLSCGRHTICLRLFSLSPGPPAAARRSCLWQCRCRASCETSPAGFGGRLLARVNAFLFVAAFLISATVGCGAAVDGADAP